MQRKTIDLASTGNIRHLLLNYLLSALPQIKSLHLENTKPVLAHSLPLLHAELLELFLYSLAHLPKKLAAPKKDLLLLP